AGESFALSALFSEIYLCNAIAEIPSRVISYPKSEILTALQTQPDLAISFLQNSCHKNHSLKTRLELYSINSARDRILQYLLTQVASGENNINFDRTYKDIASELGLSPETLYRNIAELEKEGIIHRTGRRIELITPET
ncbi:MAG: Crp/Fnr family transcriptional regulator, partial [Cyanobacteria bacterium P01_A01_bin.45]